MANPDNIISEENEDDNSKHWYLGVFYFNPKDKRIFPPKRGGVGWTVNFGNPYSVAIFLLIIGIFILLRRASR
jgi:uncharacterized membrane protein